MSKPSAASVPDVDFDEDSAEVLAESVIQEFQLIPGSTNVDDVLNAAESSPSAMPRQQTHPNEASTMDSVHSNLRS